MAKDCNDWDDSVGTFFPDRSSPVYNLTRQNHPSPTTLHYCDWQLTVECCSVKHRIVAPTFEVTRTAYGTNFSNAYKTIWRYTTAYYARNPFTVAIINGTEPGYRRKAWARMFTSSFYQSNSMTPKSFSLDSIRILYRYLAGYFRYAFQQNELERWRLTRTALHYRKIYIPINSLWG